MNTKDVVFKEGEMCADLVNGFIGWKLHKKNSSRRRFELLYGFLVVAEEQQYLVNVYKKINHKITRTKQ